MTTFKLVLFYVLLATAAVSVAGNGMPADMEILEEGVVDYVDPQTGELVVNDSRYRLDEETTVRMRGGASASLDSLSAGATVRIFSDPARQEAFDWPIYVKAVEVR